MIEENNNIDNTTLHSLLVRRANWISGRIEMFHSIFEDLRTTGLIKREIRDVFNGEDKITSKGLVSLSLSLPLFPDNRQRHFVHQMLRLAVHAPNVVFCVRRFSFFSLAFDA